MVVTGAGVSGVVSGGVVVVMVFVLVVVVFVLVVVVVVLVVVVVVLVVVVVVLVVVVIVLVVVVAVLVVVVVVLVLVVVVRVVVVGVVVTARTFTVSSTSLKFLAIISMASGSLAILISVTQLADWAASDAHAAMASCSVTRGLVGKGRVFTPSRLRLGPSEPAPSAHTP